jgi:HAE1 family hydrophobic/amphiphilic exporter-1
MKRVSPIVRFAVERKVTMGMAVLGIMVLGWLSLNRLPLEFLPSWSSSNISVNAPYASSSPEEIERLVVRPLEDTLGTINNIDTMSSSASANQARVNITFVDGTDMDMAAMDVRDRVERARHLLPEDLERVQIRRFQSTDIPVLRFDVSAGWPQERLFDYAENVILRRLERLEGVAQIGVRGLRVPQLQVNLEPARLQAHRLDVRSLVETLRAGNVNVSAGDLRLGSRKLLVRAVGEFATPAEIRALPINGSGLRLGDVAEVRYDFPQQDDFSYLNGVESLSMNVNKASTANLLAVVDRVKAELEAIVAEPDSAGLSYRIFQDASLDVRKGLGQLRDAGLIGGLLAVLAVFFFLRRFRTTALIALAMPVSVVATFVFLYFLRQGGVFDITLNVVSLAGLMLALGMLVDNSIVVIESIFRHRNELGESARSAALHGASEVALPIVMNIGVTVCIVIVSSLLVALTVVPMAAVFLLRTQESRPATFIDGLMGLYGRVLGFTLRHRLVFVVSILVMFAAVVYLFTTIERSFAARSLERQVVVKVDTPRQYSLAQTRALYEEIYAILDAQRDALDIADIAHSYDRSTGRSRAGWRRNRQFDIYLEDESESDVSTTEARDRLRALLPVKAGVELRIATSRGRHGSSGIEVELSGPDAVVLELLSKQVAARLSQLPMIEDVDTSLESGDEEIRVEVQRERALQTGLSSRAVAFTVSNALSSRAVSHFKTGEREADLIMQFREEDRETLDQLKNLPVFAAGTNLPLGAVADFEVVAGPRTIERENHREKVTVSANAGSAGASFGAIGAVSAIMSSTPLPPGYEWSFGRWNRHQQRDQNSGLFTLLFALPLVYMLMAALFESFAQPFTIMFSVPFALLGVGVVMKLADQPWDSMTMLGLIVLLGVVVNNAIVLIDHINYLRQHGLERTEAIIQGGQHRMRPILITAVTTILGLMPMVAPFLFPQWFGPVEGRAATWAPIGLVIIGGLTTSTFLTLVIIPTIYSLIDDFTRFTGRVARAL